MCAYFHASLEHGEAVLRFPYDDEIRLLLRAIPGRRWDPEGRAWRIPLDPDRAEALARLVVGLRGSPIVTAELAAGIRRLRGRRHGRECFLDLARPDERWWLSFAIDRGGEAVEALLEHPGARRLPAIGRGLVPLDEESVALVQRLAEREGAVRLSEDASHALTEHTQRAEADEAAAARRRQGAGARGAGPGAGTGSSAARDAADASRDGRFAPAYDAELRTAKGGSRWVVISEAHERQGRTIGERDGLEVRHVSGGGIAFAAVEHDAVAIDALIEELDGASVHPHLAAWLQRAAHWRGTIDVGGSAGEPTFLLIGDSAKLPRRVRRLAAGTAEGTSVPLSLATWELIDESLDGWSTAAARRCVAALREGRPAPSSVLEVSEVHEQPAFVLAPGHDGGQQVAFAALPGALPPKARGDSRTAARAGFRTERRTGHEHEHLPAIHADPFCVPALDAFLAEHEPWIDADALELLQEIREQHAHAAGLVALSEATDAELKLPSLAGELKPFQRAGVRYLLSQRRAFLADEQGLGKTIEALATIEADGAFPAVVVCPASLKLNWAREAKRWLPERSVRLLSGVGGGPTGGEGVADITIVNYDIVAPRVLELAALAPRALVLDEAHYCKNATAKRTQAVARLSAAVPSDGIVLALTGTPVMNRPAELVSQLRIIGRLSDFGSGAKFGRRFRGGDAHLRLHWHLRSRCFVRRLKADVLPQLPAKTRSVVPVELDNEAEYRHAERDLIGWLRTQPLDLAELDAKVAAALRAERLVRLNALKLLAAQGKLHAALAWVHDFLSSGERLVLFARHRNIQHAVLQRFPDALHILGEDSQEARDAAVSRFQGEAEASRGRDDREGGDAVGADAGGDMARADVGGDMVRADAGGATVRAGAGSHAVGAGAGSRLIVCSIEAAGHGITLTRASNVAFLELDWTPAKHDQAEDRCHRIGQQDAVNATYLLAAGTIDETIATLLERKRAVIGAVTDGRPEDEEGVIHGLVRELRAEPYRHLRAVA